jgi:putative transposase
MTAAMTVSATIGVAPVLAALGVSRATFYRHRQPRLPRMRVKRKPQRTLSEPERTRVLSVLHSERFVDRAPIQVFASLLDEGVYHCSWRTMYRILAEHCEVRERRDQCRHPHYRKPELVATRPNQVWSWDITKLRTFEKWIYLYLYVLLDLFSRYVVGWLLATVATAELGGRLIAESMAKQGVGPGEVTVHNDRGSQMTARTFSQLMVRLGVVPSYSRPHVPDDNPYSESHFKTLKYYPGFPALFTGVDDGIRHCRPFFCWYNNEHAHSGLGLLTPAVVHYGRTEEALRARGNVLREAWRMHPERFVNGPPRLPRPPSEVWLNKPPSAAGLEIPTAGETEVVVH